MSRKIGQRVQYYKQRSERLVIIKIKTEPEPTTISQVYMLTSAAEEEEVEKIYEEMAGILKQIKSEENLFIMGDFNAVVGKGKAEKVAGNYGLGKRNERGSRLLEFCTEHKLVIANTWFQH